MRGDALEIVYTSELLSYMERKGKRNISVEVARADHSDIEMAEIYLRLVSDDFASYLTKSDPGHRDGSYRQPDHGHDLHALYRPGRHLGYSDQPFRRQDRSRHDPGHSGDRCDHSRRHAFRHCHVQERMDRSDRPLYYGRLPDPGLDHAAAQRLPVQLPSLCHDDRGTGRHPVFRFYRQHHLQSPCFHRLRGRRKVPLPDR